jgi:DivIVA domain-containing protein
MLTPKDVNNLRFTSRRIRAGYDMDQVDIALEDCEYTISMLGGREINKQNRPRRFKSKFSTRRRKN